MSTEKFKFKKDSYSRARGGSSEFLNIYCASCQTHVALYQKDGPGSLLRMYLDRIFAPPELSGLQLTVRSKKEMPALKCPKCQSFIGTPMVYELENRLAFRLNRGTFSKKRGNGIYPPK